MPVNHDCARIHSVTNLILGVIVNNYLRAIQENTEIVTRDTFYLDCHVITTDSSSNEPLPADPFQEYMFLPNIECSVNFLVKLLVW
ncbi:MAG: hypothetical protein RBG13Loki_2203 [Promethearchaeota archaeon CR_4]|nr:MAG: hypothetical protein RBG13Loki_2203 [Candidatus Lokiarchaeota archaeon CR_4]